jgi:hypothetical protein
LIRLPQNSDFFSLKTAVLAARFLSDKESHACIASPTPRESQTGWRSRTHYRVLSGQAGISARLGRQGIREWNYVKDCLRDHPKPANEGHLKTGNDKARDIDSDERAYSLRQHGRCLERREQTTSYRTGEARMDLAAHRASHGCASRNSERLPEGRGDRGATTACLGTASTGITGQRGDPRLWSRAVGHRKTGQ